MVRFFILDRYKTFRFQYQNSLNQVFSSFHLLKYPNPSFGEGGRGLLLIYNGSYGSSQQTGIFNFHYFIIPFVFSWKESLQKLFKHFPKIFQLVKSCSFNGHQNRFFGMSLLCLCEESPTPDWLQPILAARSIIPSMMVVAVALSSSVTNALCNFSQIQFFHFCGCFLIQLLLRVILPVFLWIGFKSGNKFIYFF